MKSKFLRIFSLILFTCLTAIAIKACSLNNEVTLKPFKVGLNSWPGYQIALYAKEAGIFRKHGLDVEFVRFINQQDNIRATMRGAQDVSFVPLPEVMQVDTAQDKPVFVMVVDISSGSDGISARPEIKSVKDLKGKKVSAKLSTVSHLVLLEALKANQLKPEDIEIVDVINERGANMLKKGEISASTLWEPLMTDVAKAVGGKVIHTTADVDSVVIDGLATRSSIVSSKQDELVSFIESWFDVMKAVETKPKEVFASVAKQLGITTEVFTTDYQGLKKGDLAMNRRMFEGGRLREAYQQTRQLLLSDPRHGRNIREDVEINAAPITKATKNWQT
jgi:NitT/TauT family transport system substrate-binding protein